MRTARITFGLAGLYGLLLLLPLFFIEPWLVPAPSRPEDYYGFLGAAAAAQLFYLMIASDPVRFRPFMPLAAIAKLAFFVPVLVLWVQGRVSALTLDFASIDAVLAAAFIHAWRVTPRHEDPAPRTGLPGRSGG